METFAKLYIGMTHTLQKKITIDDTALNYGTGKIEGLFATPQLVAFMIEASALLVDPFLPEGFISVGNSLEVNHFKSTVLGSTVTIEVIISGFEKGRYLLKMKAYDEFGQIGDGMHSRSIVNYKSLLKKAQEREQANSHEY